MNKSASSYCAVFILALLVAAALGAANLFMGDLNQDEGWYLYAAQSVADGKLPYRDFAFTQGPMLPLVYSLASPVIDAWGVGGGRALTWLLGFAGALIAAGCARRLGGAAAGVIAFSLIAVNVYQSYFTTVVKTYALCAFFLVIGFSALSRFLEGRKSIWLAVAGAGLAAAAGTRVSSGILLPLTGIWLLVQHARWGKAGWVWFGAGGGIVLLAALLPLYIASPEGFTFGLIEYHTLRESGGLMSSMVLKAGFVSRLIQFYFLAAALLAILAAIKLWRPFKGQDTGYHQSDAFQLVRLMWASVVAVTLVHITAPFPYDDYQTPVFPVLAIALAVSWAYGIRAWSSEPFRWRAGVQPDDPRKMKWFVWVILILSAASTISSPINMEWMIAGRDRIWWIMKDKPAILLLRDAGREIRAMSQSDLLLTQDTYLAVEAGMKVPAGWEMGPFSYYPDMPDERAETLHLVNRRMLLADIASQPADVAAFSGYSLSIASPEVIRIEGDEKVELEEAVSRHFEPVREVPRFGQAATTLTVFTRKPNERGNP